jgi:hypothetical protein
MSNIKLPYVNKAVQPGIEAIQRLASVCGVSPRDPIGALSYSVIQIDPFVVARMDYEGRPPKYARWRVRHHVSHPFFANREEYRHLITRLRTDHRLDDLEIAAALDLPEPKIKELTEA